MNKEVEISELYECQVPYLKELFGKFTYPWEILPNIGKLCDKLLEEGIPGFAKYSDDILIGENVKIAKTATLEGKCIIGPGTEIRPGAYLRGNIITGTGCVLGNSSEFKNAILLNNVQCPHYNYVGDSILGNFAHTGAGTICSNLKSDGKNVVIHGDIDYVTGLRKVGSFIGDHGDVGSGCVLNPGTVIGKNSQVYPLTPVRGVVPANCIVKTQHEVVMKRSE